MDRSLGAPLSSNATTAEGIISRPQLPLALCLLFLTSGSSGLIFEVVWLRMLTRTLGSTVYAASTILAVFMAGLALGSFVFGRFADRVKRPLVFYACLEAGIGVTALISLGMNSWPAPLYRAIYSIAGDSRAALTLGQVLLTAAALLIPTTLMGAALPTLCAYGVRRSATLGRIAGTLYALNTLGAMAGVLASGYVLIGAVGESRTIMIGAAINVLVAVLAVTLLPGGMGKIPEPAVPVEAPTAAPGRALLATPDTPDECVSPRARYVVLACFAVSGFVSLALEIVWSRMLTLYLGTSIYAFTSMLAVMLAGIAAGGMFGGRVERWKDPLLALGRLQLGVACCAAAGLAAFVYMDRGESFFPVLVMVGPAAVLLGIAFPVAVRCYTEQTATIGRRVGELYAWNTLGCILGSLAGGFVLMPLIGTGRSGALLAGLAALSGIALLAVHPRGLRRARPIDAVLVLATLAAAFSVGDPYREVLLARAHKYSQSAELFAHVEEAGATSTAVGIRGKPKSRALLVNGVGMTTLFTGNKLMAHLPLWFSDSPRDALVICMGMGTTFRSAARHTDIDTTVVELVPAVARFMKFFHEDADSVIAQPNTHVVVDDGRNYLLMHEKQFDIITIDPAPPLHSAGTVNLYTREFFELCMQRIRPTGTVCLWVPPAPASESAMVLKTFATVFPFVSVWAGADFPGFYLMGTLRPIDDIKGRITRGLKDRAIVADLDEWDDQSDTPDEIMSLWLCDRDKLLEFTRASPVVSDDHPYTEFPRWRLTPDHPQNTAELNVMVFHAWLYSKR